MSRTPIKTIKTLTNEPEEFICDNHKDLDRNAKELKDAPMIFVGLRTNRDQQWAIRDLMELKDPKDPEKGVKNMGEAFRYIWNHIVLEVKNVVELGDSFTGDEKNALWDAEGMDEEVTEACTHFYTKSSLTDAESKT